MPKIVVMMDGIVIKEAQLTRERTTIGRRPYNDVVIENLAVSGEHAALHMLGNEVSVEDLNSTNGTFVNARAVKKQVLQHGDILEVGKHKIRFESAAWGSGFEKTIAVAPRKGPITPVQPIPEIELHACIKVLSGPAEGREMPLTKVVTTVGKPGVAIAAITRRQHHFDVRCVEGSDRPLLNGVVLDTEPVVLNHGDQMVIAGTKMQFLQT
jgi:hypothetical protein